MIGVKKAKQKWAVGTAQTQQHPCVWVYVNFSFFQSLSKSQCFFNPNKQKNKREKRETDRDSNEVAVLWALTQGPLKHDHHDRHSIVWLLNVTHWLWLDSDISLFFFQTYPLQLCIPLFLSKLLLLLKKKKNLWSY